MPLTPRNGQAVDVVDYEPRLFSRVPPMTRPNVADELTAPPAEGELPRRYPNWQRLGFESERDAAYWHYRWQQAWPAMEARLSVAKEAVPHDEWSSFLAALVAVTEWQSATLDTLRQAVHVGPARAKHLQELLIEHGFVSRVGPREVYVRVERMFLPQLQAASEE